MAFLALTCHILVGLIFAASAVTKLRSRVAYRDFRTWVASLPLCAGWMAGAVVATEVAIVGLLVIPTTTLIGMWLAVLTAAVFTGETLVVIRRRLHTACRCFGASRSPMGVPHVIRNGLLFAVAAAGALATSGQSPAAMTAPATALSAMAAAFSAPFLIFLDDLVALFFQRGFWAGATNGPGGSA